METNNSESKKTNASKNNIDENEKNITENTSSTDSNLHKEVDVDADGNKILVDRARDANENTEELPNEIDSDDPNAKRGVTTDKQAMKTVENKDLNSDITPNRYPNSHPDNHRNRGNMKLDE